MLPALCGQTGYVALGLAPFCRVTRDYARPSTPTALLGIYTGKESGRGKALTLRKRCRLCTRSLIRLLGLGVNPTPALRAIGLTLSVLSVITHASNDSFPRRLRSWFSTLRASCVCCHESYHLWPTASGRRFSFCPRPQPRTQNQSEHRAQGRDPPRRCGPARNASGFHSGCCQPPCPDKRRENQPPPE